jgi:hypothetical protein
LVKLSVCRVKPRRRWFRSKSSTTAAGSRQGHIPDINDLITFNTSLLSKTATAKSSIPTVAKLTHQVDPENLRDLKLSRSQASSISSIVYVKTAEKRRRR